MKVAHDAHPHCIACGSDNQLGLKLRFTAAADGSVEATWGGNSAFEGYPGMLHGGLISMLLDGAMTNCLFAHGQQGMTGELNVRFRHPVAADRATKVRAWIDRSLPPLYILKAELVQDEAVKARATGKFVDRAFFDARRKPNG